MITLKLIFATLKKYWKYFAVGLLVLVLLFMRKKVDYVEMFNNITRAHDDELSKIDAARKKQNDETAQARKTFESTMSNIEKTYAAQGDKISAKEHETIKRILKESGDDPDQLATELQRALGRDIKIIQPIKD